MEIRCAIEAAFAIHLAQQTPERRASMAHGLFIAEICTQLFPRFATDEEAEENFQSVKKDVEAWVENYVRTAKLVGV